MESNEIFNKLRQHWFLKNCEDEFSTILGDDTLSEEEKEIKSLDFLRDTFYSFLKENNHTEITLPIIEVMLNWSVIMYLQIKEKNNGNETNI